MHSHVIYVITITLSILTYCAVSINTLRTYDIDSLSFTHHPYKNLLKLDDDIIYTRDTLEYTTYIGIVKLHTGVPHNDEADAAARSLVEGRIERDKTFTREDPPIGGLEPDHNSAQTIKTTPPHSSVICLRNNSSKRC